MKVFIRGTDDARPLVFHDDSTPDETALADCDVYTSQTVCQLKAMPCRAGILAEGGTEPHRLDPTEDNWALRPPL